MGNPELEIAIKCTLAVVLGAVIGLERSYHGREAGTRTHAYVCLGAALSVIVSTIVRNALPVEVPGDVFRIPAQVVSGVGFLGVGTIFVRRDKITGLTTAAGIWTTAMVGLAIGYGCYTAALIVSALMLVLNVAMVDIRKNRKEAQEFYFELNCPEAVNGFCDAIEEMTNGNANVNVVSARSKTPGYLGVTVMNQSEVDLLTKLRDKESVVLAVKD